MVLDSAQVALWHVPPFPPLAGGWLCRDLSATSDELKVVRAGIAPAGKGSFGGGLTSTTNAMRNHAFHCQRRRTVAVSPAVTALSAPRFRLCRWTVHPQMAGAGIKPADATPHGANFVRPVLPASADSPTAESRPVPTQALRHCSPPFQYLLTSRRPVKILGRKFYSQTDDLKILFRYVPAAAVFLRYLF